MTSFENFEWTHTWIELTLYFCEFLFIMVLDCIDVGCWLLILTCIKLCWHLPPAVFVRVFLARICICVGAPDWESAWATAYWSSPPAGGSGCDLLIQGERVWSSPLLTYWHHHHHHHRHLINQSGGENMQMCIKIRYFVVVGSITQPGPTLKICLTVNDNKSQNCQLYMLYFLWSRLWEVSN